MQKYATFRPTPFDCAGLGAMDRQEWLVAPVVRNRDSGPLEESNFESALQALGGESRDVEIHRFGHWGPGWFEIILVKPGSEAERVALELENSLADYPVLDEQDLSAREWADYLETWNNCGMTREFARELQRYHDLGYCAKELLCHADDTVIREFYEAHIPSGDYYESCENGANFGSRLTQAALRTTRDELAKLLRNLRVG